MLFIKIAECKLSNAIFGTLVTVWLQFDGISQGVDLRVSNLLKGTTGVKPGKAEGGEIPSGFVEEGRGRIEDWG